jgi:peptidyl-prolyl cis-trans isomerase C
MNKFMKSALLPVFLAVPLVSLAESDASRSVPLVNEDIKRELSFMPERDFNRLMNEPMVLANFIDRIDLRRALVIAAEKQGLPDEPKVANALRIAYENMLVQMLREKMASEMVMPDFTPLAREQYQAERQKFVEPEKRQARHILLTFKDEAEKVDQQALLESLRTRIASGEIRFADAAAEHSEDKGSAEKGGDLGAFGRGRMVKAFEEAAFALTKAGELSPVVETQFGLHLIQLDKLVPQRQLAFEEVKDSLIVQIRNNYMQTSIAESERDIMDNYVSGIDMQELIEFYNLKPASAR